MNTSDRLRECEQRPSSLTKIRPHRRSIFREEGLDDMNTSIHPSHPASKLHKQISADEEAKDAKISLESKESILKKEDTKDSQVGGDAAWFSKLMKGPRPQIRTASSAPPSSFSTIPRVALLAFLVAVVVPGFRYTSGKDHINISGADAGVIRNSELVDNGSTIEGRANSPTDICTRWAHQ